MASTNDLSTSLLGKIPRHECDERDEKYDEEEGCKNALYTPSTQN
jgi:hypothetical protein